MLWSPPPPPLAFFCEEPTTLRRKANLLRCNKSNQAVNQSFADAIQDVYKDGDLIWVHDYHLTMLPQMLRNVLPAAKIGFFLHLPFPSSEVTARSCCLFFAMKNT